MAATVSDKFKREILDNIYQSYLNIGKTQGTDSDRFYLGIGRAEEWDSVSAGQSERLPPVPNPSENEVIKYQESLQSLKLITDISYVVPRYNWTFGNFYSAWDNEYSSNTTIGATGDIQYPYYVITDDNSVFVCLAAGYDDQGNQKPSLYKPTKRQILPFSNEEDGYVWKFLFTIGAAEARKFLTSAYMPVEKFLADSEQDPRYINATTARQNQWQIQDSAVRGQIVGIAIDSGGTGYTTPPTVSIIGTPHRLPNANFKLGTKMVKSRDSAEAVARVANGSVFQVVMKRNIGDSDVYRFGQNYANASIHFDGGGGTGAKGRAIIVGGDSGMGSNPVINLNSSALMFHTTLTGTENNDFNVRNDFRQVGLIKNPQKDSAQFGSFVPALGRDSATTAVTAQVYKKLYVTGAAGFAGDLTGDQLIVQGGTGLPVEPACILDYFDATNEIAYVHQTRETGFQMFESDATHSLTFYENRNKTGNLGTCNIVPNSNGPNLRPAEADRFSGTVIYIDNRVAIVRDDEQTEDVKIVIDL